MEWESFKLWNRHKHEWKPVSVDRDGNTRHYTHVLEVCSDCKEQRIKTYNGHHPASYFMKKPEVNDVKAELR